MGTGMYTHFEPWGRYSRIGLAALMFACMNSIGTSATSEGLQDVKATLEQMGAADQAVRNKWGPFLQSGDFQSKEFRVAAEEMAAVDAGNLARLEQLVELSGWPDARILGADAGNAAFLVLQHSPLSAQQKLLPMFRAAVSAGKARADHLALLEDRIRTSEGKKQLYGTQITAGNDGKPRVSAVEDPQNLDARRKAVGLPPMNIYLERAESELGVSIDRSALEAEGPP
jgi:hypothetical protein